MNNYEYNSQSFYNTYWIISLANSAAPSKSMYTSKASALWDPNVYVVE